MVSYGFQDEIFRLIAASNWGRPVFGRLLFEEMQYSIIEPFRSQQPHGFELKCECSFCILNPCSKFISITVEKLSSLEIYKLEA